MHDNPYESPSLEDPDRGRLARLLRWLFVESVMALVHATRVEKAVIVVIVLILIALLMSRTRPQYHHSRTRATSAPPAEPPPDLGDYLRSSRPTQR